MELDILIEDRRWKTVELAAMAERVLPSALRHLGYDPAKLEISLLACNDARIAELNADFRGKPVPTNVLSWPENDLAAARDGEKPTLPRLGPDGLIALGDIAIAYETCLAEAAAARKPVADHVMHLLVHGLLHLLGYDHERDRDATLMEELETEILGKLGVDDPYMGSQGV